MEVKNLICEELETEFGLLEQMSIGTDEYKSAVDGVTKLADRYIAIEKLEIERDRETKRLAVEAEAKLREEMFREQQTKRDEINRWVTVGISVLGIVLPLGFAAWGTIRSFQFEEHGTITTTMGRGWLNKLLPKK